MPRTVAERRRVSVIGPGNLGSTLALSLHRAGWEVRFLAVGRGKERSSGIVKLARRTKSTVVAVGKRPLDTELVWITVPDDAIAAVAERLAGQGEWRGRTVFHSSGALTSDVLAPLREKGARVASVHPAMTFVRHSAPRLEGVPFGVEGDAGAVRLARKVILDLGGSAHRIKKHNKVLYHAFDTFASPMLIALMTALEQVGKSAGIKPPELRTMTAPLLRRTLDNYLQHGAAAAFSGALVRGDVATVRRHLAELRTVPEARAVYTALARAAVKFLPVKNRAELERELRRTTKHS